MSLSIPIHYQVVTKHHDMRVFLAVSID